MRLTTINRLRSIGLATAQSYLALPTLTVLSPSRTYGTTRNITQPSFWLSLVPKILRKGSIKRQKSVGSKEWNPATFYIIMFLLIGSNYIQMIAIDKEFAAFSRRTNVKISLLQEVIKRIKNGETVDVEGILGTGIEKKEKEWEDVMKQIASDYLEHDEQSHQVHRQDTQNKRSKYIDDPPNILPNSTTKSENTRAPPGFF